MRQKRQKKKKETMTIEKRRLMVATMLLRGQRPFQIAASLKVSRATICQDEKALLKEWRGRSAGSFDETKARELEKLENVEAECFVEMNRAKAVDRMSSARSWLDRAFRCMERRAKLIGLDAPIKTDVTSGGESLDYGDLVIVDYDGEAKA